MENQDAILASLEEYNKDPSDTIPTILEEYLLKIASTGETMYAWNKIKKLFVKKMDMVINEFEKQIPMADLPQLPNVENVNFENMKRRLHNTVDRFDGIPFTIQRLCELLTNPKKHYKRTDKFMRGLEKNLLVVSTVDPFGNKIVNEKQVTTHHAYINGLDAAKGMGNNRSDTTPLTPFLPPLNQSPSSTSPFAWFNTQITNLAESAGSVAPWNFTGTPMGSQAEEAKCGEGTAEGSRTSQDGDGNSSGSTGSSEGDNMEESRELDSENVTSARQTDNNKDEEGNAASGRPDRDPNEEPPAKRFKEDDSPDSNEGGQGDIGEIKIQITTATPDKVAENEAEALQDKDAQKAPGALSVSHTPEEVCDRRSSGGFEVTSSAGDENKTEPHRSDSGGFEVSSSAVSESKAEPEVQSQKSDTSESKPLEEQLTEKEGTSLDADKMEEGSCSEAEASSVDMVSNAPSDSDDNKSDIDTDVNPEQRMKVGDAESRTESTETAEVQSTDAAVESCESGSKQEVTSSTNSELTESGTNVCESENKSVTTSENEAVCSTPVADDENSNQSDEMYFDASCATPEKKATQSQTATQVFTETQEVDSSEQPETNVESASNNEPTSSEGNDSPSEPMDTN